jgi:hypothetical protein
LTDPLQSEKIGVVETNLLRSINGSENMEAFKGKQKRKAVKYEESTIRY